MIDMKEAHRRVRLLRACTSSTFGNKPYSEVLGGVMRLLWKRFKAVSAIKANATAAVRYVGLVRQFVYGDTEQAAKEVCLNVVSQWIEHKFVSIHLEDVFDSWTEAAMKRKGYEPLEWRK